MKIALIEDRIKRIDEFAHFELRKCKTVSLITGTTYDEIILNLQKENTEIFNQYDCIISHRSALNNELRDRLKKYCAVKKRPLVFFSGGISSGVFKDTGFPFLHINARSFYSENLSLFISEAENRNIINLMILQFGSKWKLTLLLNLRNNIARAQNKSNIKKTLPDLQIDESGLIKRIMDLKINSLIKSDLMNNRTEGILLAKETSLISDQEIQLIANEINDLINQLQ